MHYVFVIISVYFVYLSHCASAIQLQKNILDKILADAQCFTSCMSSEGGECVNFSREACKCSRKSLQFKELYYNTEKANAPKLHCRTYNSATLLWNNSSSNNEFYFVELQNLVTNYTRITPLTTCTNQILENLHEATNYVARLWCLSQTGDLSHSDPLNFYTLHGSEQPLPVSNFYLDKLELKNDAYDAHIKWTPAEDLQCHYDLVWFEVDDSGYRNLQVEGFETTLDELEFGKNISVWLRATSGGVESDKTTLNFQTPSCWQSFANLTKCPPPTPANLKIEEIPLPVLNSNDPLRYDVKLSWEVPTQQPDYYTVILSRLNSETPNSPLSRNVSGDATFTIIEDIELGIHYQIALIAHSVAGASEAAAEDRFMTHKPANTPFLWSPLQFFIMFFTPLLIILLVITLIFFISHYRSKKSQNEQRFKYFQELERKNIESADNLSLNLITQEIAPDEWELDLKSLCPQQILGEGAFGVVHKALLRRENGSLEVAVKMMKHHPSADEVRQFMQEIEIMKSVKPYRYIVSMIGCVTRPECTTGPVLVVEYCSRGDLQSYLRNAWEKLINLRRHVIYIEGDGEHSPNYFSNKTYDIHDDLAEEDYLIEPKHLLSIARQIALGMEHLAKMRVVHRDLAARNILVCSDHSVKVSDFGLSRDIYQDNVYCKAGTGKLPVKWMALESLTHQRYTTQSDVWSYGVLLWEITTLGGTPYAGIHCKDLLGLLRSGYRLDCPGNCSEELYAVMHSCWKAAPKDRPTFTDLCKSLEMLLENVCDYLRLELDTNNDYLYHEQQCRNHLSNFSKELYLQPTK